MRTPVEDEDRRVEGCVRSESNLLAARLGRAILQMLSKTPGSPLPELFARFQLASE